MFAGRAGVGLFISYLSILKIVLGQGITTVLSSLACK